MNQAKKKHTGPRAAAPDQRNAVMKSLKGAIIGLVVTVLSVLILALIVKQGGVSDAAIGAVNQIIKVVSIFLAAFIASRGLAAQQAVAGAMAGGVYVVLGYLTFSLIDGHFGDILMLLADLAMGLVIGMLTALIFGKLLGKKPACAK